MFFSHAYNFALDLRANSPDPSTKVGAVVVDGGGTIVGSGFNSFHPGGVPADHWENRVLKNRHVVHAEVWAILMAGPQTHGASIYVTSHPCRECAKLIAAAGIRTIYCPTDPWRDDPEVRATCNDAGHIFAAAGIERL